MPSAFRAQWASATHNCPPPLCINIFPGLRFSKLYASNNVLDVDLAPVFVLRASVTHFYLGKMSKLFSIITITKNSGSRFESTASSIKALHCQEYEWIVVDGGDDAYSQIIIDRSVDSQTIVIREKDRGISHAFNIGISYSSARYILFLNAGDTYTPDFLDACLSCISPTHILCGSASLLSPDNLLVGSFCANPAALWRGMHIPHNWMCAPASIYHEIGGYREMPDAMDYEWCKRVISNYGMDIFRPIPGGRSYGHYLLGGHSDKRYTLGLRASRTINIEYGMNPLLAWLVYSAYRCRHLLHSLRRPY